MFVSRLTTITLTLGALVLATRAGAQSTAPSDTTSAAKAAAAPGSVTQQSAPTDDEARIKQL